MGGRGAVVHRQRRPARRDRILPARGPGESQGLAERLTPTHLAMKPITKSRKPLTARPCLAGALLAWLMLAPFPAHASMFKGEALDKVADVLTWVVLIIA